MVRLNESMSRNQFIIPSTFKKTIEEIAKNLEKPIGELVREGVLDLCALLSTNIGENIAADNLGVIDDVQRQILGIIFQRRLNFGLKRPLIESLMETPSLLLKE